MTAMGTRPSAVNFARGRGGVGEVAKVGKVAKNAKAAKGNLEGSAERKIIEFLHERVWLARV